MDVICVPSLDNEGLNGEVSQHLGKTPYFVLIKWENDQIAKFQVLESESKHLGGKITPGEFIAGSGANILLCGNLGQKAVQMIEKAGIKIYVGASGTVLDSLHDWAKGNLQHAHMNSACADGHH